MCRKNTSPAGRRCSSARWRALEQRRPAGVGEQARQAFRDLGATSRAKIAEGLSRLLADSARRGRPTPFSRAHPNQYSGAPWKNWRSVSTLALLLALGWGDVFFRHMHLLAGFRKSEIRREGACAGKYVPGRPTLFQRPLAGAGTASAGRCRRAGATGLRSWRDFARQDRGRPVAPAR